MAIIEKVIRELVIQQEKEMLEASVRSSESEIKRLIAEDFYEFGSSGRAFGFQDLFPRLQEEKTETVPYKMTEVQVKFLSDQAVLLTYKLYRGGRHTLRSSIWEEKTVGWQMTFHQGTIVPED